MMNGTNDETTALTLDIIASAWISMMQCHCLEDSGVPESMHQELVAHFFSICNSPPSCENIMSVYEFRVHQGRNPTQEELAETMLARYEIERDPEAYWEKTKHQIPTPNLDNLQVVTISDVEACPLCQEDISKGSTAFRMPCCKQYYHCDAKSCLGESTIMKWLSGSRKCPGCGQEVIIHESAKRKRVE